MASKIGRALGYSMDKEDNGHMAAKGYNDEDIDTTVGGLPGRATKPAVGDSDDDLGEDSAPDSGSMTVEADKSPAGPEEIAMKLFSRAKSPSEQAAALKAFGEACGWGGQSDSY